MPILRLMIPTPSLPLPPTAVDYVNLIGFSTGTVLFLFLTILLARVRNPRPFDRLLFLLFLSLFLYNSGFLLTINTQIYYTEYPFATALFAGTLVALGLAAFPVLLLHVHFRYLADLRVATNLTPIVPRWLQSVLIVSYLLVAVALAQVGSIYFLNREIPHFPSGLGWENAYLLLLALLAFICAGLQFQFSRIAKDRDRQLNHLVFALFLLLYAICALTEYVTLARSAWIGTLLLLSPILPGAVLVRNILRHNTLGLAGERNLVYAVTVTFAALLYLGVVRRISVWLEPWLPPEATTSILLFLLVLFFEPLQRLLSRALQRNLRLAVDRWQRLLAEFQSEARRGDLAHLINFIESRLASEFRLSKVVLALSSPDARAELFAAPVRTFPLRKGTQVIGALSVSAGGQPISGETAAALEFIADQLPAALDLCRLIEEKLTLERELAERERLALVGQMAASISHNLKNPLGSIKTLLQLQLENPDLPESLRRDTSMILGEIDRLGAKLNQLLRYSKPSVRSVASSPVDAAAVADQIVTLLRAEADRRNISLSLEISTRPAPVAATEEALSDVLSNLIVNALEALPAGGAVRVHLSHIQQSLRIEISDDGPGIPAALREKIMQPFFTTKPSGTGLGLAIVARRLTEMNASLDFSSPAASDRGTSFIVTIPLSEEPV